MIKSLRHCFFFLSLVLLLAGLDFSLHGRVFIFTVAYSREAEALIKIPSIAKLVI